MPWIWSSIPETVNYVVFEKYPSVLKNYLLQDCNTLSLEDPLFPVSAWIICHFFFADVCYSSTVRASPWLPLFSLYFCFWASFSCLFFIPTLFSAVGKYFVLLWCRVHFSSWLFVSACFLSSASSHLVETICSGILAALAKIHMLHGSCPVVRQV